MLTKVENNVALVLDVDGTIIDSYEGIIGCYLQSLKEHGYSHPESIPLRSVLGPPMGYSMARAGVPEDKVGELCATYMDHYLSEGWLKAAPYAGMKEFIMAAKEAGYVVATGTSKGTIGTKKVLSHFGLIDFFDFLGTAGTKGERPTKTDVIRYTLDNINAQFSLDKVIMIGDRMHDIEGARNNSLPVIAVEWGYGTDEERARADYRVATVPELERTINEWLA
ncbi:MAG: HAD hydrolase-like protein [Corynebacterium sp.]|nr:HAD hydrolase-like protein [Corynebacterium sp.]